MSTSGGPYTSRRSEVVSMSAACRAAAPESIWVVSIVMVVVSALCRNGRLRNVSMEQAEQVRNDRNGITEMHSKVINCTQESRRGEAK